MVFAGFFAGGSYSKVTLNDLKKWKKLCDDGVITAEEFVALKNRVFADEKQ